MQWNIVNLDTLRAPRYVSMGPLKEAWAECRGTAFILEVGYARLISGIGMSMAQIQVHVICCLDHRALV